MGCFWHLGELLIALRVYKKLIIVFDFTPVVHRLERFWAQYLIDGWFIRRMKVQTTAVWADRDGTARGDLLRCEGLHFIGRLVCWLSIHAFLCSGGLLILVE